MSFVELIIRLNHEHDPTGSRFPTSMATPSVGLGFAFITFRAESSQLLFSSYRVEISVDIHFHQHSIPGIGIPAKVIVARVTDELGSILAFA